MTFNAEPFTYRIAKSGDVYISREGRLVVMVRGNAASKLAAALGNGDESDQQLLARATGNYKRGNERQAGSKRR